VRERYGLLGPVAGGEAQRNGRSPSGRNEELERAGCKLQTSGGKNEKRIYYLFQL
jgi:hypothetical protein